MGSCVSTGNHGLGMDGNGKMDISGIKEDVQSSHMNQAAARKIKELVVTDNNIASIPPSVGKVLTLTSLNCSVNQLEELPNELLLLVNLTCLDASDNKLKKLPDDIGNCLLKLETLHLYKNLISTLPGKIIGIPSHGILHGRVWYAFKAHDTWHIVHRREILPCCECDMGAFVCDDAVRIQLSFSIWISEGTRRIQERSASTGRRKTHS